MIKCWRPSLGGGRRKEEKGGERRRKEEKGGGRRRRRRRRRKKEEEEDIMCEVLTRVSSVWTELVVSSREGYEDSFKVGGL